MLCASTALFAQKNDVDNLPPTTSTAVSGAVQLENDGLRKFGSEPLKFLTPSSTSYGKVRINDNGITTFSSASEGQIFGLGVNSSGSLEFIADGVTTYGTSSTKMIINDASGNIGIGTLNPTAKLQIDHGGSDNNPHINIRSTGLQSRINWTTSVNAKKWIAQSYLNSATDAANYLRFEYNNGVTTDSDVLVMNGLGNVGIGNTSPDVKLHVTGLESDGTVGTLKVTSGVQSMIIDGNEIDVTSTGLYLNNNTNLNVILATGGGNVGIGTTTPNNKLDVLGTIRANEVIVETGWADYVFADDYQLNDLETVEAFIKENKHLPNVPAAKEINEKGAHVAELMTKMMEKIEELMLYTIRQQKEIDALKVQLQTK